MFRSTKVSRYPSDGNLQSDLETLESMTKDPPHAAEILLTASPIVFRAHWALLISLSPAPTVSLGTAMAPELDGQGLARFGSFDTIHRVELNDGWQPGHPLIRSLLLDRPAARLSARESRAR